MRMPGMNRNQNAYIGVETKGKRKDILLRLTRFVLKNYKFSFVTVAVCIVITAFTTLASTLFTRTLIDDYIVPLTQTASPDYGPLAATLTKLALILLLGVV